MTDFSVFFASRWRDGEAPKAKPGQIVINHDQKSLAYDLGAADLPAFTEWAAITWETDQEPRGEDETAEAYLGRIGATVRVA